MGGQSEHGGLRWFKDDRYLPEKQARYVGKLTELRSSLLQQEQDGLSTVLSRFQTSGTGQREAPGKHAPHEASAPERHWRQQQEKVARLQSKRQERPQPRLGVISGKALLGRPPDLSRKPLDLSRKPPDLSRKPRREVNPAVRSYVHDPFAMQRSAIEGFKPVKSFPEISSKSRIGQPHCLEDTPDEASVASIRPKAPRRAGRLLPLRGRPSSDGDSGFGTFTSLQRDSGPTLRASVPADSTLLGLNGGYVASSDQIRTAQSEPTSTSAQSFSSGYSFPGISAESLLSDKSVSRTAPCSQFCRCLRLMDHVGHQASSLKRQSNITERRQEQRSLQQHLKLLSMSGATLETIDRNSLPNFTKCILCKHPQLVAQLILAQKGTKEPEAAATKHEPRRLRRSVAEPAHLAESKSSDIFCKEYHWFSNPGDALIPQTDTFPPTPNSNRFELRVRMPQIAFDSSGSISPVAEDGEQDQ